MRPGAREQGLGDSEKINMEL